MRTIFFLFIVFFSLLYTVKAQGFFTSSQDTITLTVPSDITLGKVSKNDGAGFKTGDTVKAGDLLAIFVDKDHNKIAVSSEMTGKITYINETFYGIYRSIPAGTTLLKIEKLDFIVQSTENKNNPGKLTFTSVFRNIGWAKGVGGMLIISVGLFLIYLGISKQSQANINRKFAKRFIKEFENTDNKSVRIQYGLVAGWFGIYSTFVLFVIKMTLGIMSGSVSMIANAFHLLSHLANSIILVISFKLTARPATAKNPFGHGRMEHIAPLIMSIFLFVSAIQMGEHSLHQAIEPHELHYWPALPWILLFTIVVKQWLSRFVTFLGKKIDSHAILTNAAHHNIEMVMTLTVIGGLIVGHYFHHPEVDGYIGILVSAWLLYLGYTHGKEAIVPLLGQAPSKDIINKIRETAQSVKGIENVHEIIVHDYGSKYLVSLHAEIPAEVGAVAMHEITEICEHKLRQTFGGEAVCHMDPMMKMTPEIKAVEDRFKQIINTFPQIVSYHDFRVVAGTRERIIIVADIDLKEEIIEDSFNQISKDLGIQVKKEIKHVLYCNFYITPKFSY